MTAAPARDWTVANQAYLNAALAELAGIIAQSRRGRDRAGAGGPPVERAPIDPSAALERAAEKFALTSFERDLLLLCAGIELDAEFARECRAAAGGEPTFGFALAALPDAHWSAITPTGPLRYWRLVELRPSDALTAAPLRIDERMLHYLAGVSHLDERLHGIIRPHQAVGALSAVASRHCRPDRRSMGECGRPRRALAGGPARRRGRCGQRGYRRGVLCRARARAVRDAGGRSSAGERGARGARAAVGARGGIGRVRPA